MEDIPDGVWTEFPLPAVEGRCWPERRIVFENNRWQMMYRYPVPTIKITSKVMRTIVNMKRRIQRAGGKAECVRFSPKVYEEAFGLPRHRQYDEEQVYGRICGLDIYIGENTPGIMVASNDNQFGEFYEYDPDL